MQPQFTHRVLGIRCWTLSLESHQFCMSKPPQRIHSIRSSSHSSPLSDYFPDRTLDGPILASRGQVGWSKLTTVRRNTSFYEDRGLHSCTDGELSVYYESRDYPPRGGYDAEPRRVPPRCYQKRRRTSHAQRRRLYPVRVNGRGHGRGQPGALVRASSRIAGSFISARVHDKSEEPRRGDQRPHTVECHAGSSR